MEYWFHRNGMIECIFFSRSMPNSTHRYINRDRNYDGDEDTLRNRFIAKNALNLKVNFLQQSHSNKSVFISNESEYGEEIEADSQVTTTPNLGLAVMTADCVPILLFDKKNMIIAACHAGWKGAFSGVIENTIIEMRKHTCSDIECAIGPSISKRSYEVDAEFFNKFMDADKNNIIFFDEVGDKNKYLFDIRGYAKSKLMSSGISRIVFDLDLDTYRNSDLFFSYRRYTHSTMSDNTENYGSLLSVISIKTF